MRIDLHTHSTASDGTDSPAALIEAAAVAGLDVVALTDHDTTAGWQQATEALPDGLTLVPGAELSCACADGKGGHCTVHLLAYLFDPQAPAVLADQARLRAERRNRLRRMAESMAADGLPVDPVELMDSVPPDAAAGRPHLARMLVRSGVVSSVNEAFDKLLATGGPYHLEKADTPVLDAISMIAAAGGVTVLAHAFAHHRGPTVNAEVIATLAEAGMTGLEVAHPDHDAATQAELRALAADLRLLPTGSSDYHGVNKCITLGQETTDPEVFHALCERAQGSTVIRR